MLKILLVSSENLARTLSNHVAERKPAFMIVPVKPDSIDTIRQINQAFSNNYKFVRATYNNGQKSKFYREIGQGLNLSLVNEQGQPLNISESREIITRNVNEGNILFLPGGAKLFELSSLKSWLTGLVERGAIIITSDSKYIDEDNQLLFIHLRLHNRYDSREDIEVISPLEEDEKVKELPILSFLYPKRLSGAIERTNLKSPPVLALFFSAGLLISLLPPLGSTLNGILLYAIASCALVWFIVWG